MNRLFHPEYSNTPEFGDSEFSVPCKPRDNGLVDLSAELVRLGNALAEDMADEQTQRAQAIEDRAAGKPVRWCDLCAKEDRLCWWHQ